MRLLKHKMVNETAQFAQAQCSLYGRARSSNCAWGETRVKILEVKNLAIPEVKVIRFARFHDHRGYFAESFRRSDFRNRTDLSFLRDVDFLQCNESYSQRGTIRGLHFQWNPFMGKLIRTLSGHMVDLVLDIRKGSPTFGKIIAYDMPNDPASEFGEWIWVPPGFGHGNFFNKNSQIEYFCSGEYSPGCEAGISPLASDIDWSICEPGLRRNFAALIPGISLITEKDRNGYSLDAWTQNPDSNNFLYLHQERC
jgi:dTDP-4-dehydrorhamnose 3,5-epimerase